eukprot:TRINITY_DN13788_c0_g1_i1.p1 TRINITY_DN13788_c0_g1~~TRINITY_DN13788_c0_g1_i1.p1  ORF type:complete len:292 (+),score=17.46 TRINITY_DN13788_c0_g1_i1:49-924(+)
MLKGVYDVANVYRSSVDKNDVWKQYWMKATGLQFQRCQIEGCENYAQVGGHMYVSGTPSDMNYILPICSTHNNAKYLDCAYNYCPQYLRTKRSAVLVPRKQNQLVAEAVESDFIYQECKEYHVSSSHYNIIQLRTDSEVLQAFSGRAGECTIFFSKNGCVFCKKIEPQFNKYASEARFPCYLCVSEEVPEAILQLYYKGFVKGFPTIIKIDHRGPQDITGSVGKVAIARAATTTTITTTTTISSNSTFATSTTYKAEAEPLCQGVLRNGEPCSYRVAPGNRKYCRIHGTQK